VAGLVSALALVLLSNTAIAANTDGYAPSPSASTPTLTWLARASMPTGRRYLGVVRAENGMIYAIGGTTESFTVLATVEAYDPKTNVWSTKASMPTARYNFALAAARNGKIYAVGGDTYYCCGYTAAVEEYNPATDQWTTRASLPYAIGGQTSSGGSMATVESYDLATNAWRSETSLPTGLDGLGAATARNGGIYVIGGNTSSGVLTTNEVGLIRP
jgi:N-acetylneuraminic acid mutarotase